MDRSSFGGQLSTQELDLLARYTKERVAQAGTVLFCQGEPADGLYFVSTGRVSLTRNGDGQHGPPLNSRARNGDVLGNWQLLASGVHSYSALCQDRTRLQVLSRQAVHRMQASHPELAARLRTVFDDEKSFSRSTAQVVTFFSAQGGSGKSFLASAFATTAATTSNRTVVLVELDLQFGSLARYLAVEPSRSIGDLLASQDIDCLRGSELLRFCVNPVPHLYYLARPRDISTVETISAAQVTQLLRTFEEMADLVVIDTRTGFDELTLAALDLSDTIHLTTTTDRVGVSAASMARAVLDDLGYADDKVHVILNRSAPHRDLAGSDITRMLGTMTGTVVPEARKVHEAVNRERCWFLGNGSHPVIKKMEGLVDRSCSPRPTPTRQLAPRPGLLAGVLAWFGSSDDDMAATKPTRYLDSSLSERLGQSLLAVGQGHFLRGSFDKAARTLRKAIAEDPTLARAYEYLAEMAEFDDDLPRAVDYYRRAYDNDPTSLRTRVKLALLDGNYGNGYGIMREVEAACRCYRNHSDKRLFLALLRHQRDDLTGAHDALREALRLNPQYTDALVFQGRLFFEEQRYVSSLSALLGAIASRKHCVQAYFLLGRLLKTLDLLEFARRAYRTVLSTYGGHRQSHGELLELLEPLSLLRQEVKNYGEAVALNPDFGDLRFNRARALYQLGDFPRALDELRAAAIVQYSPHAVEALRRQIEKMSLLLDGTFVGPKALPYAA